MAGNGEDESEERTPLDDLSRSIKERREGRQARETGQEEDIWEAVQEETGTSQKPFADVVIEEEPARITDDSSTVTVESIGSTGAPGETERTQGWVPEYPSGSVFIIHGLTTAAVLLLSLVIYMSAVLSLIPRHYWIISLPLLALALFGIAPMVAWYAGIWNPKESV